VPHSWQMNVRGWKCFKTQNVVLFSSHDVSHLFAKFACNLTVFVYVAVPTPNLWTAVVVGVAVGVFLGICLLFLLHYLLQHRYY